MRKRIAKFTLFSLLLSASLFTPQPTYAGSFWGWETEWEGSYLTDEGCLYHVVRQHYNVFGIDTGSERHVATPVAGNCTGGTITW